MSAFPSVQPNEIGHKGHRITYCGEGPVTDSTLCFAVVRIEPVVVSPLELVIGIGANPFAARADAFKRGMRLIDDKA